MAKENRISCLSTWDIVTTFQVVYLFGLVLFMPSYHFVKLKVILIQ